MCVNNCLIFTTLYVITLRNTLCWYTEIDNTKYHNENNLLLPQYMNEFLGEGTTMFWSDD